MDKIYLNNPPLLCALTAAQEGAQILKKYWGRLQSVEIKSSHSDLVTIADKESEKVIIERIKAHFPDHAILAEESGLAHASKLAEESKYLWIIDPLDGTTNYTHCYPMVSISIALMEKGQVIIGVIFNPFTQELFYAERGKGAYLNDQILSVSSTKELTSSLLATGFAYDRLKSPETNYTEFGYFTQLTQGVRRGGSAALDMAYVAAGRLDGYWERGIQPWDVAAGLLMVEEAGGRVSAYDTSPIDLYSGKVLATNGAIHETISGELMKLSRAAQ